MATIKKYDGLVLTSDAHQIFYRLYRPGCRRVIIIAHGFFTSKQSPLIKRLAEKLAQQFDVLTFDFRGHGESDGVFTWTAREYRDLEAVVDRAREQYDRIGLLGFSLGAATGLISIARRPDSAQSLVCVSTPTQLSRIDYHFWDMDIKTDILYNLSGEGRTGKGVRAGPFWLRKHRPVSLVKNIRTPVCFVHGAADWVIKPVHSRRLYTELRSSRKHLEIIPKGTHAESLIRTHEKELLAVVQSWFEQTLD